MMPSTVSKRNAILPFLLGIVPVTGGCGERLSVDVVLRTPVEPDPFTDVARLRVTADLDRGAQTLAEVRWDQGPVRLPVVSSPAVQRIVVEGLTDAGRVVASGASQPLDLLASPPNGPVSIDFTRIGVLSTWPDPIAPRHGSKAVDLGAGRFLAVGGVDDDGCPHEDTVVFGPARASTRPGPALPGGRAGAFSALRLPNGEVVVLGGWRFDGCNLPAPPVPWRLNPADGRGFFGDPLGWPDGVSVAPLSDSLVLGAGGFGPVTARTEVMGLDPRTLESQFVGRLSIPRARGTLVALGARRALMLGGQTQTSTSSALDNASVFEPSRGATIDEPIGLGDAVIASPAIRTPAGSVVFLSPDQTTGRSEVKAVAVKQEREVPLGDVSPVTVATGTDATALLALADGSLLSLGPRTVNWIQLLPRQSLAVPGPAAVWGGTLADGTALLFGPDGRRYTFNPGPAATLGWRGPAGALVAREGPSLGPGLVPRRPERWRLTRDGLEGEQLFAGEQLGEWAFAVDREWADFDLTIDLRVAPGSRALILWGADRDRFTFAEVGPSLRVGRFGARAPPCPTVAGPDPEADGWTGVVRIRRQARRVVIEPSPEGTPLACTFEDVSGWLGLGVGQGTVTFSTPRIGRP